MANDSLFDEFIRSGNLRKAALIANSVLLSVSQETSIELQERYKVLLKPLLLKTCYLKSEIKLVRYDHIQKAKSVLRAKHAKKGIDNL